MKKSWNIQVVMFVVFFFVFGSLSAGATDSKKVLVKPQKMILQKASPATTKAVKLKVLPDLSVSSIKITPKNPMDSDEITLEAVIHNIGKIATSSSFFKIQIGGKIYPLIKVSGLSINQKWKYNSKINIKRHGNYRITATINPNKKIKEIDYKNNTLMKTFRVRKAPPKPKSLTPPAQTPAPQTSASVVNTNVSKYKVTKSGVPSKVLENKSILAIPDNIYRDINIKSSEYLGQGRWKVEIENNGNFFVYPNQIEVFAWFFGIGTGSEFESSHFKNKTTLSPNETETIIGFGLNQNGECGKLHEINFIALDTVDNRKDFVILDLPRPSAVIDHITIRNGAFACDLENKSPFPVKAKIRIVTIEIWDDYKLKDRDQSVLGFVKDLVYEDGPGIDFDGSGYDPQVLKCSAANIELGTVTIPAATSSNPYSGVSIWGMSAFQFKQLIRAKCPNADFGSYSYIFKNLKVELITENVTSCNTSYLGYTPLHTENVGSGGSKDNPAFSW